MCFITVFLVMILALITGQAMTRWERLISLFLEHKQMLRVTDDTFIKPVRNTVRSKERFLKYFLQALLMVVFWKQADDGGWAICLSNWHPSNSPC